MRSAAIIVGIDEYAEQPLTSAVNDAEAFRDLLLELKLVPEENIRMLTAPAAAGRQLPTKQNIANALFDYYIGASAADRLYFFYAGHGMLTFGDAARTQARTVLVPSDVERLERDGLLLLDLDEVIDYMQLCGPREQLYFIDACRDLAWEHHPSVQGVGWGATTVLGPRTQSVLYAVSPLGKAVGQAKGLGAMTTHLLKAFRGDGIAGEYDEMQDRYIVTTQSVHDYVSDALRPLIEHQPLWRQKYILPELVPRGPRGEPIRELDGVGDEPLTIHIEPEAAAQQTRVELYVRRVPVSHCFLPPRTNHETFTLPPQRYFVKASSTAGVPDPERYSLDLRKEHELRIRVSSAPAPARSPGAGGPATMEVDTEDLAPAPATRGAVRSEVTHGRVKVSALEQHVSIELEALESPYQRWSGIGTLDASVPAGPYRVRLRLGVDVFNEMDTYVQAGEQVTLRPSISLSPLLQEALGVGDTIPRDITVSESIGPLQAALLPTILPILGIKPFDVRGELFSQFEGLVPTHLSPELFDDRPLSVVIAVDGNGWSIAPHDVLRSIRCTVSVRDQRSELAVHSLGRGAGAPGATAPDSLGFARIGLAIVPAPGPSFALEVSTPHFGRFSIAGSAITGRATVFGLTLRPDGSFDLSQNILRVPGRRYDSEPESAFGYGRMLRDLQLGQKLYESGELVSNVVGKGGSVLEELMYAKWTDPILSCMAYLAWRRETERPPSAFGMPWLLDEAATNLAKHFGELPDSRVVYGLQFPKEREAVFDLLLRQDAVPVLAEGALALSDYAVSRAPGATVVRAARRLAPGKVWTVDFDPII